jgi:hypothetical protein
MAKRPGGGEDVVQVQRLVEWILVEAGGQAFEARQKAGGETARSLGHQGSTRECAHRFRARRGRLQTAAETGAAKTLS